MIQMPVTTAYLLVLAGVSIGVIAMTLMLYVVSLLPTKKEAKGMAASA